MTLRANNLKVVDMLGLLHKAPRTAEELADLTGMSAPLIRDWLQALMAEGLTVYDGQRDVWSEAAKRYYLHDTYAWAKP